MPLKTNRELTNKIASLKQFIPEAKAKVLTPGQAEAIISINTNSNPADNKNFLTLQIWI